MSGHMSAFEDYTQLNTIPAVAGIAFAVSSAVQFLDASISIGAVDWTFEPAIAMVVSLGALIVAFASSDTRDWRHYDQWEQAVVAVGAALIPATEYVVEVSDFIAQNDPVAGLGAFLLSFAAWGVLAQ